MSLIQDRQKERVLGTSTQGSLAQVGEAKAVLSSTHYLLNARDFAGVSHFTLMPNPHELDRVIIPILQMRKVRQKVHDSKSQGQVAKARICVTREHPLSARVHRLV